MHGGINTKVAGDTRLSSNRLRRVALAAAATVAAVALSTGGALVLPVSAAPTTVETNLAEHTNPAVQVITTEYQATVKLGRIEFSKAGQQLVLRAYVKYARGDFGASGFVSYIFDRAQRDPSYYFKEAGAKRTQKLSAQFVGSGFVASPEGYVVTARHVVTPDGQVKKMFATAGASNFAQADANALLKDFRKFDLSTGAMKNIVRTVNGFAQAKVHVDVSKPKVAVRLGVASATGQRVGKNQPAEVVFRSDPALGADVAVLRIRVDGELPTVPLGSDSPQQGEQVYINAFPAAATYLKDFDKASQLQPTLSKGSITALKNTSGGTPILQTDANAMPGSSGGAAFDESGQVVGMLVSGAVDGNGSGVGQNYLMPLDVIKDALSRSGADLTPSQTTVIYDQALSDFHNEYYSKALGEFQQVKDLFPAHAYVGGFITKSQTAINQGKDKTPSPAEQSAGFQIGTPMIIVGLVVLVIIVLAVAVLLVVRRRPKAIGPVPYGGGQSPYAPLPTGGAPTGVAMALPAQQGYPSPAQPQAYPVSAPPQAYPVSAPPQAYPVSAPRQAYPVSAPRQAYPSGPQQPAYPVSAEQTYPTAPESQLAPNSTPIDTSSLQPEAVESPDAFPGWEPIDYVPSGPPANTEPAK